MRKLLFNFSVQFGGLFHLRVKRGAKLPHLFFKGNAIFFHRRGAHVAAGGKHEVMGFDITVSFQPFCVVVACVIISFL